MKKSCWILIVLGSLSLLSPGWSREPRPNLAWPAPASALQPAAPKQGDRITNSLGMEFIFLAPGEFLMGSEKGDDSEKPVHRVVLTRGFYLGATEVTQEQFEKLMGRNPSSFKGAKLPVNGLSFKEAQEFCQRLSQKENVVYSLPTEAQWEYACRAGSSTEYYWGQEMDPATCWYLANSQEQTHEVGKLRPNAFGLYDMSGNVYEICLDWHANDAYQNSPMKDPAGPSTGLYHVLRGGSWANREWYCRSSSRVIFSPRSDLERIGFRLVRAAEQR